MFVGATKLSAETKFAGRLWVFPLRNLLSYEAEQRCRKREPQLQGFFSQDHVHGQKQPVPVHENKL